MLTEISQREKTNTLLYHLFLGSEKYNKQRSRLPGLENKRVATSGEGRGQHGGGEDKAQNFWVYNRLRDVLYAGGVESICYNNCK